MATHKLPAYLWYVGDARSDEVFCQMTYAQQGVYRALLDQQWIEGSIPREPQQLARLLKMRLSQFVPIWALIGKKFRPARNHRLVNDRLERQRRDVATFTAAQANRGRKGAAVRWHRHSTATKAPLHKDSATNSAAINAPMLGDNSSSSSSSSSSKEYTYVPETPPADTPFQQFAAAYPAARRQAGYMVEQAFLVGLQAVGFEALMAALAQHKTSEQWTKAKIIPSMKTWLMEQRWQQVLPEAARPIGARPKVKHDIPPFSL